MSLEGTKTTPVALTGTLIVGLIFGLILGGMFLSNTGIGTPSSTNSSTTFILEAKLTGFVGISDNIKDQTNPDLKVPLYSQVTIILRAGESMEHNLVINEFQTDGTTVSTSGTQEISHTFTADQQGIFQYYCAIPGHSTTMNGRLIVGDVFYQTPDPAKTTTVSSIIRKPSDILPPVGSRPAMNISFTLVTQEVTAEIEPGTTLDYWTFNSSVPGPLLRVRVGDNVTINLVNPASSTHEHSVDLHAATDIGGGSAYTKAQPGETKSFTFNASHEGVFVYHCASPNIATHISLGMYGAISVEPVGGLPSVNKEFYVGQNEIYTKWKPGTAGHQEFDSDKQLDENPTYVVFNGKFKGLTDPAFSLNATKDDDVRIFFAVGGPNLASNFHIIGEVMDQIIFDNPNVVNLQDAETVVVPPGSAIRIEMHLEKIGHFILVDHAISRAVDKGCMGFLYVNP
ncbi:MAG: multicopper oxidase domain-containing protein [Candidatus Thorarchaeota archaeon]